MKVRLYSCGGETPMSEIPLGIGYLKTNVDVNVQVAKDYNQLLDAQIVGLSTNAWGCQEAFEIATALALRSDYPRTVVVGGQGALWPGWGEVEVVNYIVHGSGERALQQIVDAEGGPPHLSPMRVLRVPIENLDDLAFPDRGKCGEVVPFVTSRGCPYGCAFCSSKAHWGKPQYHSAKYVLNDIEDAARRYPQMKEVRFMDDLYITPPRRFEQLYEGWMTLGYTKRFVPHGFVRADLLTDEVLNMLIGMGVDRIRFGIESGSPRMLKMIGKGITIAQFQAAIDRVNSAGLPCHGSFVSGLPGETAEDRRLTREFKARNLGKLLDGGTYTFRPFPGCDLYNGEDPRIFDMRVRSR